MDRRKVQSVPNWKSEFLMGFDENTTKLSLGRKSNHGAGPSLAVFLHNFTEKKHCFTRNGSKCKAPGLFSSEP